MKEMTKLICAMWLMTFGLFFIQIKGCIVSEYQFEKKYSYAWSLADKSSTIEAKFHYINEFVDNINSNKDDFCPYNAIFLKTKDNSFEYNIKALNTLRDRLSEIKEMDTSSFQYNTAIQQITAQEQGEALNLIRTINGCYDLKNFSHVWDWIGFLIVLCGFIFLIIAFGLTMYYIED